MFYAYIKSRRQPAQYDHTLVWSGVLLLALGLVMVYSSSIAIAEANRISGQQPMYYLMRHGVFLAISIVFAAGAFQFPLRFWQQAAPYLFLLGAGLLTLVLVPG